MDETSVRITLSNLKLAALKAIYAFIDAELEISGIVISIQSIQVRHLKGGGTSIHLPTYRDAHGNVRSAVRIPPDLSPENWIV